MNQRVYLDHNATSPLRPQVRAAVMQALELDGNPSSVHAEGRAARAAVEEARAKVAALVGARPEDVVFTSGGTEANALALAAPAGEDAWHVYLSAIEHPSVLARGRFHQETTTVLPVTSDGLADLDALAAKLEKHKPGGWRPLVSLMAANNETGALQPIEQAAEIVQDAGGILHSDAVQRAGRLPIDIEVLGTEMLTLSGHKIGGPKGVGALVLREEWRVAPLLKGGGQEGRRRAGTENVPGIVGFGVAAELAAAELPRMGEVAKRRDALEARLRETTPDLVVLSGEAPRLPNTSAIAVPGVKAETLVIGLDLEGVAVSAGAACSSGKVEASHVLAAMGVAPEISHGAIRVSLGLGTTDTDIESFLKVFSRLVQRLKMNTKEAA